MEEILSSIKRIIAEDSEAALSAPRVKRSVSFASPMPVTPPLPPEPVAESVLELTEAVAEPAEIETVEPIAPKSFALSSNSTETPMPASPEAKTVDAEISGARDTTLVSSSTLDASRSSLAALSALVVKPEVNGSDTLEGLVRELVRPMIAEWLDSRLPDIVDRMVKQEIQRITRG